MKLFRNGDCWLTGLRGQACGCASPYSTIMHSWICLTLSSGLAPHSTTRSAAPPALRFLRPRLSPAPTPTLPWPTASGALPGCPVPVPWRPVHTSRAHCSPCHPPLRQPGELSRTQAHGLRRRCEHAYSHAHTVFGQGFCALAQSPQREPVYWDPGVGCRDKRSFVQLYVKVTNSK